MGLDMYLSKRVYIGANYEHRNVKIKVEVFVDGVEIPINQDKITYIEESVAYWRKANQIHAWFIHHTDPETDDDCTSRFLTIDTLKKLLEDCKKVLKNPKLGPEILPTQEGCFFGNTDYDDEYLEDLKETVKILSRTILKDANEECEYVYSASW